MKKTILILSLTVVLMMANSGMVTSQDKPKPKKDTVNMDTDAKPTYYYAVEDEKTNPSVKKSDGSIATIVMIVGAVVIVGVTVFFLIKKKK